MLKYRLHIISKRLACLQDKIHIHAWFYFENMVTRNMEICDLNSYSHYLMNIRSNRSNSFTLIDHLGLCMSKHKSTKMNYIACSAPGTVSSLLSIISSPAAGIKPLLVPDLLRKTVVGI